MSHTVRVILVTIAAIATIAFSASSASAQTVEVHPEGSANHCSNVTVGVNHAVSGGCTLRAATETGTTVDFVDHDPITGEQVFTGCTSEFEAHINEDGLGFITNQSLSGANCGIVPCDEADPNPHPDLEWPIAAWEGGPGIESLAMTLCLRPAGAQFEGVTALFAHCSIALELTQGVEPDHSIELQATDANGDGNSCTDIDVELEGHWISDASEGEVEIEHVHSEPSSETAQTVEVHPEGSVDHCSNVTVAANHAVDGGCAIHITSEAGTTTDLVDHDPITGEQVFSLCTEEFEAHINEDGLGFITDQVLAGAQCGLEPCDEAEPDPHHNLEWPLAIWEGGPGIESLVMTLCVRAASTPALFAYCSIALELTQGVEPDHSIELQATDANGDGTSCIDSDAEVEGHWVSDDSEGELEIEHLH